jgi:predicted HTH domain antitoxin
VVHMTLDMPEEALASLRTDSEEFVRQLRLAAAVKWYELRRVSQERAAKIAGLSRTEFMAVLGQFGVSPFQCSAAEALASGWMTI